MKLAVGIAALAATGALCVAGAAAQQRPKFDTTQKLVITGKVIMYEPILPNSWIFIEVDGINDKGAPQKGVVTTWGIRANSADFSAQDMDASLSLGAALTATGYPHANNQCGHHPALQRTVCMIDGRQLKFANGCEKFIGGPGIADELDKVDASKCKPH
jgi:hypothetical protein